MYSEIFFNKSLTAVTLSDLESYFTEPQNESNILEFKSYTSHDKTEFRTKENEILRTICGFLNSDGGLLIWGAPSGETITKDNGSKEKIFKGALCPVDEDMSKDTFIGRMANGISPTPRGVLFHQIQAGNNKWIYVIDLPQSLYAPHQFQHIYFMRLDGHTRPAPHNYIEAFMKQVKVVNLECFVQTECITLTTRRHGVIPFILSVHNFSKYIMAFNVRYSLTVSYGTYFYKNEEIPITTDGRFEVHVPIEKTLHYNMPFLRKFYLILPELWNKKGNFEISLSVYADNCPAKISKYTYECYGSHSNPTPQIRLIKSTENQFSFEQSDQLNSTEEERAKAVTKEFLKENVHEIYKDPMMTILENFNRSS